MSNLPSENEIRGGILDSNPRLKPLLTKYENLRSVSLELHHRNTLQYESLQRESPVNEIADDICKDLQDIKGEPEYGNFKIHRFKKQAVGAADNIKIFNMSESMEGKRTDISLNNVQQELHEDLQGNVKDFKEDLKDAQELHIKDFKILQENLQLESVQEGLKDLHEDLLDVPEDLQENLQEEEDLQEDLEVDVIPHFKDLHDLQNAGFKVISVNPISETISAPHQEESSPETSTPQSDIEDDSSPSATPKVTVPILVSFKSRHSNMFEEREGKTVSFSDSTGQGELHQVLHYSGSEESIPFDVSPIITFSGEFDDLSDLEIDLPDFEEEYTLPACINSSDVMLELEKDFVNIENRDSADIMMQLERDFVNIGDKMDFLLETAPKHNALPRRIRQDSLTQFGTYGIGGSV